MVKFPSLYITVILLSVKLEESIVNTPRLLNIQSPLLLNVEVLTTVIKALFTITPYMVFSAMLV